MASLAARKELIKTVKSIEKDKPKKKRARKQGGNGNELETTPTFIENAGDIASAVDAGVAEIKHDDPNSPNGIAFGDAKLDLGKLSELTCIFCDRCRVDDIDRRIPSCFITNSVMLKWETNLLRIRNQKGIRNNSCSIPSIVPVTLSFSGKAFG